MKRLLLVVLVVGAVAIDGATARTLYVVDSNCVQGDYRAVSPIVIDDPNAGLGSVLGPSPGDPNSWDVPTGSFKRDYGSVCHPDHSVAVVRIECRGGSGPVDIDFAPGATTWSFSTVVPQGNCGYLFAVIDSRGSERLVWVRLRGRPNTLPAVQ